MMGMKSVAIAACALAVFGARGVAAQGVERIMQAREELALTDDQITGLDAIRREFVQERTAEMAEMAELRSQLEAGQIQRSDVMAAQEDRVAATEGRVDAVLTEVQRTQVEQMRTRADRVRGRRQDIAPNGPGGFGGGAGRPGFAPGGRGGFGPGGRGPASPRGQRGGAGFGGPRGFGPR